MSPRQRVRGPADRVDTWIDEARLDQGGAACQAARSAIFTAVRADRAGPAAQQLLARTADARAGVRLLVLRLLFQPIGENPPDRPACPEAASAAAAC
ncbi:hypothetical protein AB0B01_17930 [Streptomyces sp. NPDC044571]|uniref:hypothetical protein n=1 Tax=Streptomyces sp. NPDC044571 TaxID=3155371 RepID=UPI0033C0402A